MEATTTTPPSRKPLVDLTGLLTGTDVWAKGAAPSERTARDLIRRGVFPALRIGRLLRFDPDMVRTALEKNCLVHDKGNGRAS